MVKVIGKFLEEIASEKRESKLVKIAKEICGEEFGFTVTGLRVSS